jgi:hypothetical protein
MSNKKFYDYTEIFQEIPEDPEHIMLKFPEELLEQTGWTEGTVVNVSVEDTGSGNVLIIAPVAK